MEIMIPVSPGELVDKITILEIKAKNILNKEQLINICYELKRLKDILNQYMPMTDDEELEKLHDNLIKINQEIWHLENLIRNRKKHAYDMGYIGLKIAEKNDKRAFFKRCINEYCNSNIIEEKSHD